MLFSPLLERAMRVAAHWHRDHCRKASNLPYITHPAGVALILMKAGFGDDELLAASLLHDVIEDTACTLDELEAGFPPRVVEYVSALTERKLTNDGQKRSWADRKREHLEEIAGASLEARAIALADKLHNLGTMLYDVEQGEELWSRFGVDAEKILWYHRTMIDQAAGNDERLEPLASGCRALLARLEEFARAG